MEPTITKELAHPLWRIAVATNVGCEREHNEDAFLAERQGNDLLLGVFDGMGGHAGGQEASACASSMVHKHYIQFGIEVAPASVLEEALADVNAELVRMGAPGSPLSGLGTTAVVAWLQGPAAWLAHVGDSRAYRFAKGETAFRTGDHTKVARMLAMGILTAEEAENHPDANVVQRALGHMPVDTTDPFRKAEVQPAPIVFEKGDVLLLCSDGLYDLLSDQDMMARIAGRSMLEAAEVLVDEAMRRGGHDNITVALACFNSERANWAAALSVPPVAAAAPSSSATKAAQGPLAAAHAERKREATPSSPASSNSALPRPRANAVRAIGDENTHKPRRPTAAGFPSRAVVLFIFVVVVLASGLLWFKKSRKPSPAPLDDSPVPSLPVLQVHSPAAPNEKPDAALAHGATPVPEAK